MSVILLCALVPRAAVIVPASSIMTSFTRKPGGIWPLDSEPEQPSILTFIRLPFCRCYYYSVSSSGGVSRKHALFELLGKSGSLPDKLRGASVLFHNLDECAADDNAVRSPPGDLGRLVRRGDSESHGDRFVRMGLDRSQGLLDGTLNPGPCAGHARERDIVHEPLADLADELDPLLGARGRQEEDRIEPRLLRRGDQDAGLFRRKVRQDHTVQSGGSGIVHKPLL